MSQYLITFEPDTDSHDPKLTTHISVLPTLLSPLIYSGTELTIPVSRNFFFEFLLKLLNPAFAIRQGRGASMYFDPWC